MDETEKITYVFKDCSEATGGNCFHDSWHSGNSVGHWYFFPSKSRKDDVLLENLYVLNIKHLLLYSALKFSFHRRPMKKSMTKRFCTSSLQKMGYLHIYHFSLCALRLSFPISCPSYWVFWVYCSNTSLKQQQYLFYCRPHVNSFQHIFKHRVLPIEA